MKLSFLGRVFLADRAIKEVGYYTDLFPKKYPEAGLLEVQCQPTKEVAQVWTDFEFYKAIYLLPNGSVSIESSDGGSSWSNVEKSELPWDGDRIIAFPDSKLIEMEVAIDAIRKRGIQDNFINAAFLWPIQPEGKRMYTFFVRNQKYDYILVDAYTKEISFK